MTVEEQVVETINRFIEGRRVYLREVREEDVTDTYHRWVNDPEVTGFLESRFRPHSKEELRRYVADRAVDGSCVFLAIVLADSDRHIGNIKLGPIEPIHRRAEVGIMIGEKDCWGKGYAAECIELLANYAFDVLNLHKLTAECYANHAGSEHAFIKAGFFREGQRRNHFFWNGSYVDAIQLGRLNPAE